MKNQKSIIPQLIIAVFVSFALFIGYMVYYAFQVDVNLVQEDYYQESTKHDEHLEEIKRSEKIKIELFFDEKKSEIVFGLPSEIESDNVSGEVHFYRPSDGKLDFKVPIELNNGKQFLSTKKIIKGKWSVKVRFNFNNQNYFKELFFVK